MQRYNETVGRRQSRNRCPDVVRRSPLRYLPFLASGDGGVTGSSDPMRVNAAPEPTMAEPFISSENPAADTAVEQIRLRLISIADDLDGASGRANLLAARKRLVDALDAVDEQLGGAPRLSETGVAAGTDVEALAAMIASRLREGRRARGRRPAEGHAGSTSRRSVRSSLLHIDVILSAVALAIALVVVIAWMG